MYKNYCKICNKESYSVFTYPDGSQSLNLCNGHFNGIYEYYLTLAKQVNSNTLTLAELISQLNEYINGLA